MHRQNTTASTTPRRLASTIAATALAAALLAPLQACYERVTKAKGIGSDEYTVYESSENSYIIPPEKKPKGKRDLR